MHGLRQHTTIDLVRAFFNRLPVLRGRVDMAGSFEATKDSNLEKDD